MREREGVQKIRREEKINVENLNRKRIEPMDCYLQTVDSMEGKARGETFCMMGL